MKKIISSSQIIQHKNSLSRNNNIKNYQIKLSKKESTIWISD